MKSTNSSVNEQVHYRQTTKIIADEKNNFTVDSIIYIIVWHLTINRKYMQINDETWSFWPHL